MYGRRFIQSCIWYVPCSYRIVSYIFFLSFHLFLSSSMYHACHLISCHRLSAAQEAFAFMNESPYITYSLSFSSSDSFFFSDSCSQHSKYSLSFRKTSFRTSYRPVVLSFCIADIHRIRILHLSTLVRSSGTYPFENKFPTQFHWFWCGTLHLWLLPVLRSDPLPDCALRYS